MIQTIYMKYLLHIYCDNNNLFDMYTERVRIHMNKKLCDSGFDLSVPEQTPIFPGDTGIKIDHKIQCTMSMLDSNDNMVREYCGFYLYMRSSTGTKTPLRLSNMVGIIDPGYRGNIISAFDNIGMSVCVVEAEQRLVQICPPNITYDMDVVVHHGPVPQDSDRGVDGFGSTGS
jgi:dUTP pyrophosphatase